MSIELVVYEVCVTECAVSVFFIVYINRTVLHVLAFDQSRDLSACFVVCDGHADACSPTLDVAIAVALATELLRTCSGSGLPT